MKLYTSMQIDGKEVLKPSNMQDVQQWLWENARLYVMDQDAGITIRRVAKQVEAQDTVREGLRKLAGGQP